MINKNMLIESARVAQNQKAYVWLVNDNGLKIIVDNSKCSDDFLKKHNLNYDKNLLQAFTPDMILKYDTANYNQGTMSINSFLEIINSKYKN